MKICALACVKDSDELLAASISHLSVNGIGDFYICDHAGASDLARSLRRRFSHAGLRLQVLRKQTEPFYQAAMMAALMALARADGFEVGVAFDADEFWCSTSDGRSLIDQIEAEMVDDVDALRVPVVNYVQHRDVRSFTAETLLECRYAVTPVPDSGERPQDRVERDGLPFLALPFPKKVLARLSPDIRYTEGNHSVHRWDETARIVDSKHLVVRHLSISSREDLQIKREHGRRRIAAGHSPDIGWQLRRLAHMTDEQLDGYWNDNSWRRAPDGEVAVGTYGGLAEDRALAAVGAGVIGFHQRLGDPVTDDPIDRALETAGHISSHKLERAVEALIDDLGRADVAVIDRDDRLATLQARLDEWMRVDPDRLIALQTELDERSAWALWLNDQLAERERELAAIKSSPIWRAARAMRAAYRRVRRRGA